MENLSNGELFAYRNKSIVSLWLTMREISERVEMDDYDLALWDAVGQHEAVQGVLRKAVENERV